MKSILSILLLVTIGLAGCACPMKKSCADGHGKKCCVKDK
jgi:hypothetical protein